MASTFLAVLVAKNLKNFEKCPKRDGSTTPKTGYMTLFYDLWLIITPKPFTSQKEFKNFPAA